MRVLHLVTSDELRGAELFTRELVRALSRYGLEQRVALLRRSDGPATSFDVPVSVLGRNGSHVLGMRLDPRAIARLRKLVRSWRPDLIQTHGGEPLKYAVPATAWTGSQIVYRRIGRTPSWMAGPLKRTAYAWLMRRATRIVVLGEAGRREVSEGFGVPASRLVTIPNGKDPDLLERTRNREVMRRELAIPASASVVLSVAALTFEKDPLAHLAVAERVLGKCPDALYLVVGDGPMRAELVRAVQDHGLEDRVLMLGVRSDVVDLMGVADVLLLASRTEGMPGAIIEAGMLGLPVAAYSLGAIPEVVKAGETGLLVSPGDVEGLADGIVRILQDDHGRAEMGRRARIWCRSRFDIRVVASQYMKLYRSLVS